jgi:hypothetical protein
MDVLKKNGTNDHGATAAGLQWHTALYAALAVGALVGIGFFFFGGYLTKDPEDMTRSEKAAERLETTREHLQKAETKEQEAQLRRLTAENQMVLNAEQAYRNLRGVVLEEHFPVEERALAVLMMGETYFNRTSNVDIYGRKYVFLSDPYKGWLNASTTDSSVRVWDAMKQLYEYSLTFADSPIAHYRIALWYLSAGDVESAEKHYGQGLRGSLAFARSLIPQDRHMAGTSLWLSGTVAGEMAHLSGDQVLRDDARKAFDEAREFLRRPGEDGKPIPAYMVELMWTDLRYAVFLERLGSDTDQVLMDELLNEIVTNQGSKYSFYRYLLELGTKTPTVPFYAQEKETVIALAGKHPQFAQMLRDFGWTL